MAKLLLSFSVVVAPYAGIDKKVDDATGETSTDDEVDWIAALLLLLSFSVVVAPYAEIDTRVDEATGETSTEDEVDLTVTPLLSELDCPYAGNEETGDDEEEATGDISTEAEEEVEVVAVLSFVPVLLYPDGVVSGVEVDRAVEDEMEVMVALAMDVLKVPYPGIEYSEEEEEEEGEVVVVVREAAP